MASARFDILFSGKLMESATPEKTRSQLQQRFKLSEAAVERLFSGRTVTIKRNVDTATASRYRKAFRDAEALIEICPVDAPSGTPSATASEPSLETGDISTSVESGDLLPDTEPRRYEPLEQAHTDLAPEIDLSHLSLVAGNDWTLEDCQPSLPPVMLPDISHLEIVAPEKDADEEQES